MLHAAQVDAFLNRHGKLYLLFLLDRRLLQSIMVIVRR